MSVEKVVERIRFDATAEAQIMVEEAKAKAANLIAEASAYAEKQRMQTEIETQEKTAGIKEKRAADARLEGAKIMLAEKRKVVDSVYALALARLLSLEKAEMLKWTSALLERYAEAGDTVFFAENFKYAEEVVALPVVEKKSLKISLQRLPLDGGMKLVGEKSDKDLSFGALLAADQDASQAQLAKELFK